MDYDGWEILSHDGILDFSEDDGENQIWLGKKNSDTKNVLDNYFSTSSPKSREKNSEASRNLHNQVILVPIQFEPIVEKASDDVSVDENTTTSVKIQDTFSSQVGAVLENDQETFSQVSFKMKENEFVEMKMDSPKSSARVMFPPSLDSDGLKFEDKGDEAMTTITSPRRKVEKEMLSIMECDDGKEEEDGFNLWKWGLTGIGAICSFGVAAATICVLFYGRKHRNKIHQHKIQFQIYTDDKRIKQVVQHATKLNEAISAAARGVPLSRAQITYGGYYDGI